MADSPYCKTLPTLQKAMDSTSLRDLLDCPRKYQLHIIEGWQPKDYAAPLEFGKLYHSCLEVYDKERCGGASLMDSAVKAVRHAMEQSSVLDEIEDPLRSRQNLVRSVIWYIDHYGKGDAVSTVMLPGGKPAVELSFRLELPLHTPDGDEFFLCGHMDGVVDFAEENFVRERKHTAKTLSDYYFRQFTPDIQITIYTLASHVVLKLPAHGVMVDACQVCVGFSNYRRRFAPRSLDGLNESLQDIVKWLKAAEVYAKDNYWPKNEASCSKYGGCMFREICSKDPASRETWLKADFKVDKWNPLENR